MLLFPEILTLEHTRVYVCPFDGSNIIPYIEAPVNETFCLTSTLNIPDIQPDNSHIQLWGDLDDMKFWGQHNIIEDVILFNNILYNIWCNCQAQFTPGWKSAEWTRRWADLWNDLGFSLCAALSVCHVVATSDEGEKSEWEWVLNGVSLLNTRDWVQ